MKQVICNRAGKYKECEEHTCEHAIPHERIEQEVDTHCTCWDICELDDETQIKVRCTKNVSKANE